MLSLNTEIFENIVETAKTNADTSPRWIKAIDKAAEYLVDLSWVEWDGYELIVVSCQSNEIYTANSVCQCKAYENGNPCWHRAAARLMKRYDEAMAELTAVGAIPTATEIEADKAEVAVVLELPKVRLSAAQIEKEAAELFA